VSQLRTRIEMAFGLLTTKWRILKSPLNIKVRNIAKIFIAITRLHNYCINERLKAEGNTNNNNNNSQDSEIYRHFASDMTTTNIQGHSMMRSLLLEKIVEEGLSRPIHNLKRNNK
jgi:DDE superfamily endonuclease